MTTYTTKVWSLIAASLVVLCFAPASWASDDSAAERPWEKFGIHAGYFFSAVDTTVRIGGGLGIDIDMEEALGLETSSSVFRIGAGWRFTENRRHRVDLSWFSLNRHASKTLLDDITIENDDGDVITIPLGTVVKAFFDLDIYKLSYSYSFIMDDRVDLAGEIGLYIMPIALGLKSSGLINERGSAKFTAPLPEFGIRMDVLLTPRLFFRSGIQAFYVEYENFAGSLLKANAGMEYKPWKHMGIGLSLDALTINVKAKEEAWPGIDLNGKVRFAYNGIQLYLSYYY